MWNAGEMQKRLLHVWPTCIQWQSVINFNIVCDALNQSVQSLEAIVVTGDDVRLLRQCWWFLGTLVFALVWFLAAAWCHRRLYCAVRWCRWWARHLLEASLAGLAPLVCRHLLPTVGGGAVLDELQCQHELAKATDRAVGLHVLACHQLTQHPDQLWDLLRLPLCVLL